MSLKRSPENIILSEVCPHCERRIFIKGDSKKSKRTYIPPKWFRDMFKKRLGSFPLGYYRLVKCEICEKTLAMFDDNTGTLRDQVVVLYNCTLLSSPLQEQNGIKCQDMKSCYGCPLKKKEELYVERR